LRLYKKEDNITKKRLKTGLDILLGAENQKVLNKKELKYESDFLINIGDIKSNKHQPRSYFDEEAIKELADSIKAQGLLMPILVKLEKNNSNKKEYKIIAGERRWRACKSLKMEKIKAIIVKNTTEKSDALASIIENVQREDLAILEEAVAYEKLIKNYGMKHDEIAKSTGKSRSYITNLIRILKLEEKVKIFLNQKKISFGHARALLNAPNQKELAIKVINENMSVRELELYLKVSSEENKDVDKVHKGSFNVKDPNISDYEKYLSLKLGYNVEIKDKKGIGYLKVKYKNLEQLDAIVDLFNN
tara:strand:- start:10138 stop:11049 length:912 start_codon:yes stop_codon:yes gene_type:complete